MASGLWALLSPLPHSAPVRSHVQLLLGEVWCLRGKAEPKGDAARSPRAHVPLTSEPGHRQCRAARGPDRAARAAVSLPLCHSRAGGLSPRA